MVQRGEWEEGGQERVERRLEEDETLWLWQGPARVGLATPQKLTTPVGTSKVLGAAGVMSGSSSSLKRRGPRFPPSLVGHNPPPPPL